MTQSVGRLPTQLWSLAAIVLLLLSCAKSSRASEAAPQTSEQVRYRTVQVDGFSIFYREAGRSDAPTILLLHGFPSSSAMFEPLFARLSGTYHLVAPDYPGFGNSDAPDPETFAYTFDHLASVVDHFTVALGLHQYSLYLQDYGGPVGFRLAINHPERLQSLIIQNATTHEDGLGPLWETRRAFWKDRDANEAALRENLLSLRAARQRHIGSDPEPDRYNPDSWNEEFTLLSRPKQATLQSDLFYDYQTNVAAYPAWQKWLQTQQPQTLVLWGRYDPSFQVAEAEAYRRELPHAEIHLLEAGHFALDTAANQVAAFILGFVTHNRVSTLEKSSTLP